jgi:predicted AlkP superfamily phosphohydrolase/phosphomutase
MTSRTLLIGLDGATFSILDPLMDEGVMPFLERFIAGGARAKLRSTVPPLTPPAWTTVMTGRSPGNHGVLDFFRFEFKPDGRFIRVLDSSDVSCETIWSMANRHGLKTTALNFPLTSPPPPISGNMLPGWVPWRHLRLACHPADLYDRINELPGFNARELAMDMTLEGNAIEGCQKREDYEDWICLHIRRERQWFEILRHLMREDPCQLTAVLFDGVDKLQHFVWRFLDPAYFPASPSAWEQKIRALCCDYFREMDHCLEELVALAGPEANTVMVSDHGFRATHQIFYLNAWLEQNGYLAWTDAAESEEPGKLGLDSMARRFYEVDWDKSTAYSPTPSGNGIYLSLDGSDAAHENYASARQELMDALLRFTDPATGEPVVSRVWTREEAFAGDHMALAPDLTLDLRDGGFVSILPSDSVLMPRAEPTGTHHPDGIFLAGGPGICQGATLPTLSIIDVAPTLLYTLGLPVPEDLEGRVPTEVFDPARLQAKPVRREGLTQPPETLAGRTAEPPDEAGEAELLQRLRALGYVE